MVVWSPEGGAVQRSQRARGAGRSQERGKRGSRRGTWRKGGSHCAEQGEASWLYQVARTGGSGGVSRACRGRVQGAWVSGWVRGKKRGRRTEPREREVGPGPRGIERGLRLETF